MGVAKAVLPFPPFPPRTAVKDSPSSDRSAMTSPSTLNTVPTGTYINTVGILNVDASIYCTGNGNLQI